jgi:phospholipase C
VRGRRTKSWAVRRDRGQARADRPRRRHPEENHTFDNYVGPFPSVNGAAAAAPTPDPIVPDPLHDRAAWLRAQAHGGGINLGSGKADIPACGAFAQQHTLCDNYFTDVANQSE